MLNIMTPVLSKKVTAPILPSVSGKYNHHYNQRTVKPSRSNNFIKLFVKGGMSLENRNLNYR